METEKRVNGIDQGKLASAIKTFRETPELARFKFRARQEWVDGAHARTTIKSFYGAGQEDMMRKQSFVLEADEPTILLGQDHGPNATEALLHALASCLGTTFVYQAAARSVPIDHLRLEMEGEIDLRGFLGITDEVRRGFQNIRVTFDVESSAPREKIEELCRLAQKYSPVFDSVTNQVPVLVTLAKEAMPRNEAPQPSP